MYFVVVVVVVLSNLSPCLCFMLALASNFQLIKGRNKLMRIHHLIQICLVHPFSFDFFNSF